VKYQNTTQLSLPYVWIFSLIHIGGAAGFWYALTASWYIIAAAIIYFFLCHLAITVGAHRYFTHGAFDAKPVVAYTLAIFFSATAQGSLKWWCGKHLQHHENEDREGVDPHSPQDGFFHAHMGWLLKPSGFGTPPAAYLVRFRKPGIANKVIRWQYRNHRWLILVMTFILPTCIGWSLGDPLGGFLVIGLLRLTIQYHATWIVNSVGHTIGERRDNLATNFGWLLGIPFALITVGEAWHANHHISSAHWRLGREWWQVDPGAFVILLLKQFGLVSNLREPKDRLRPPVRVRSAD
jgi:stearoyl-CoA desaturase (Delta-9 desaturase)